MNNNAHLMQKWGEVLDFTDGKTSAIKSNARRAAVAQVLENTDFAIRSDAQTMGMSLLQEDTNVTSNVANYDPVMIAMVRRAMPNLMAYDVAGVQPMTGPTGLIFAMRSFYTNAQAANEAFYNEANTGFSTVTSGNNQLIGQAAGNLGTDPTTGNVQTYNFAGGMSTAQAEALGSAGNVAWNEMVLGIDKVTATAKSRALKSQYTPELAQDLKAIHGLDAEAELASMLSTEMLADMNRELVRTIYVNSKIGCQTGTANAGVYDLDVDSNGRWSVERFKGLMYRLSQEGNALAKETRRGRGNILIVSSDVASALQMAGVLDFAPALQANELNVDDTGNTFVGILNGQFRVYIDPYAVGDYAVVGYKGADARDAGLFYCPYVPLQMARAIEPGTLNPIIGFKTRYAMVANPFADGLGFGAGVIKANSNVYYRKFAVTNLG